jgi:uncharacterized phiE125 gp8 family phage protein
MIYSKVTQAPETEPVTIPQAQAHLRVTGDDAYLATLISVARRLCEAYSGLSFVEQERTIILDSFPSGEIIVPYGPVSSVDSLTYKDTDGETQTLTEDTDFTVDTNSDLCRVSPIDSWPLADNAINTVTIGYTAGLDATSRDLTIARQAILMQVASLYENRQDEVLTQSVSSVSQMHWASKELLDTIKVYWNANEN